MSHEVSWVISVYKLKKKKKKVVFLKAKRVIQSGTRKAGQGLSGSVALKASLICTDWGIVLIPHESEQSPAQQDEQEWGRGWCCLSGTRGHGCELAASLPRWGLQTVTPSSIWRMLWAPEQVMSLLCGIVTAEVV